MTDDTGRWRTVGTVRRLVIYRPASVTFLTTAFVLAAGLLSGIVIARSLGVEGRGSWTRSYLPLTLISWFGTLGVEDALSVLGVRRPGLTFQRAGRVLATLALPVTALAAVGVSFFGRQPFDVAVIVATYVPAYFVYRVSQAALLLQDAPLRWNVSRAIAPAAYGALLAALVLLGRPSVEGTLYSFTAAGWMTAIASARMSAFRNVTGPVTGGTDWPTEQHTPTGLDLVKFGLKVHLGGIAMVLNSRFDQLLLARLATARELGLYSVAASVSFLPVSVGTAESEGSVSILSRATRDGTVSLKVRQLYRRIATTALPALFLLMITSPALVPAVYGGGFEEAVLTTEVLLVGSIALLAGLPAVVGLRAVREPVRLAISEIGTAVAAIILLPWILASWGILGVAWLSTVLYSIKSSVQVVLISRAVRRSG